MVNCSPEIKMRFAWPFVSEDSPVVGSVILGLLLLTVHSSFQGMKGNIDEYSDSDDDQHDAYLERMKAEGKIREEGNDSDDSGGESGE